MRAGVAVCGAVVLVAAQASLLFAQERALSPLSLLDVPYVSQSEALCGGAAAAMVLRYWGERGIDAESFSHLVDRSAAGIRTNTLIDEIRRRGWNATGLAGNEAAARRALAAGGPVVALIEDRSGTYHYVVLVAWHDRGVIFHDPARAPFRVMAPSEFERRWHAADRWMAVIEPRSSIPSASAALEERSTRRVAPPDACDQAVARGVSAAQANQLDDAERILTSALTCPGGAALRELAGLRVLQRRWGDVADLAQASLAESPEDEYAWRLLATARFLLDDRTGALDAWNQIGEPTVDLFVVDGLVRTRTPVIARMLSAGTGETLTGRALGRAQRQLAELPAALTTRLDYVSVPAGRAELRGAIVERPVLPWGRLAWLGVGVTAASTREIRVTTGSLSGGGERLSIGWRFWPHRQRVALGMRAPAPWGGVWGVDASHERQAFTAELPVAERLSTRVSTSDWVSRRVRWEVGGGLDRWQPSSSFGVVTGEVRITSLDDRIDGRIGASGWAGAHAFSTASARVTLRSSVARRGFVMQAAAGVDGASSLVPLDLWSAGDTGHVRAGLLRAHPLLDEGRLRVERLGRVALTGSVEGQHWWRASGAVGVAAAAFLDAGRTALRVEGPPMDDWDAGLGVRVAVPVVPGVFRFDVAKGLRDGATVWSFLYQP